MNAADDSQLVLALMAGGRLESLLLQQRRHLSQGLAGRCRLAPIPVTLDEARLDTGMLLADSELALYLRYYLDSGRRNRVTVAPPLELPAHHYRLESSAAQFARPRFCLPPARVNTLSLAGALDERAGWSEAGQELAAWNSSAGTGQLRAQGLPLAERDGRWPVRALLQRSGAGPDQWTAVQHGLLLDWEPLELAQDAHHGWSAVVGLDQVGVDLSGLRMTQDQLVKDVSHWIRQEIVDIHARQVALGV